MITSITISYRKIRLPVKPRVLYHRTDRRPSPGDVKKVAGVTFVRQQQMIRSFGTWCYHVSSGRPVYEWVQMSKARDYERRRAEQLLAKGA